ncbi:MAG: hypothetical protein IPJ77_15620 [Planctomycetes bacterium]|nr:hypothetical protein [Planctomycetota bacterium]
MREPQFAPKEERDTGRTHEAPEPAHAADDPLAPHLAAWRAAARARGLAVDELDEGADHLRAAIERELVRGSALEDACARAVDALGDPALLASDRRAAQRSASISRWIGSCLAGAFVAGFLGWNAPMEGFLDGRSLALVLGLFVTGLWASFGPTTTARALLGRGTTDATETVAVLARAYALAWTSGVLATLLGAFVELSMLSTPEALATGLARAALALLYGALLAELVIAPRRALLGARA